MVKSGSVRGNVLEARSLVPEQLSAASPGRDLCAGCGLYKRCQTPFMPVRLPLDWERGRKLALVGEGPGEHEDTQSGEPFTGAAGRLLRRLLREAGYAERDVVLLNAVRCRPPGNRTP